MKKRLKEIINTLNANEIPWLNVGGCAIFAALLYKALRKEGFLPRIINLTDEPSEFIWQRIKEANHPRCNHMMVRVGKYFVDSTGVYSSLKERGRWYHDYQTPLPLKVVEECNKNTSAWNPYFDREKYVPVLKKKFRSLSSRKLVNMSELDSGGQTNPTPFKPRSMREKQHLYV